MVTFDLGFEISVENAPCSRLEMFGNPDFISNMTNIKFLELFCFCFWLLGGFWSQKRTGRVPGDVAKCCFPFCFLFCFSFYCPGRDFGGREAGLSF